MFCSISLYVITEDKESLLTIHCFTKNIIGFVDIELYPISSYRSVTFNPMAVMLSYLISVSSTNYSLRDEFY